MKKAFTKFTSLMAFTGAFSLSVMGLGVLASPAAQAEDVLRLGTEGAYPPFNAIDADGNLIGFDIDIGNALCEEMKRKCEWVVQDWEGMIPALLAKKYDVILASMSITEERKQTIDFTRPYYTTPAAFYAKKGSISGISEDSLSGKRVGVQVATVHQDYMNGVYPDMDVVTYQTIDEINLDLAAGRIDVAFADSLTAMESFLAQPEGKDYGYIGDMVVDTQHLGEGIGVGIRKEDRKLRDEFNKAIEALHAKGIYQKINEKHVDVDLWPG